MDNFYNNLTFYNLAKDQSKKLLRRIRFFNNANNQFPKLLDEWTLTYDNLGKIYFFNWNGWNSNVCEFCPVIIAIVYNHVKDCVLPLVKNKFQEIGFDNDKYNKIHDTINKLTNYSSGYGNYIRFDEYLLTGKKNNNEKNRPEKYIIENLLIKKANLISKTTIPIITTINLNSIHSLSADEVSKITEQLTIFNKEFDTFTSVEPIQKITNSVTIENNDEHKIIIPDSVKIKEENIFEIKTNIYR